jgi:hypothetical protein
MPRFISSFIATIPLLVGCGSAPPQLSEPQVKEAPQPAAADDLGPVEAGSYTLRMTAPCGGSERTATGTLTLQRLSGADAPASRAEGEGALLWGQTDIDFEPLRACLGGPRSGSEEPIHPSVLVEVLHWDAPQQQVLLASTDRRRGEVKPSGAGIALWVASVGHGRIEGVWSRWELKRAVEGRFEAELTTP